MKPIADLAVRLSAADDTAKGVKSAEKRLGQIPKHVGEVNRRVMEQDQRRVRASSKAIVRTFGEVERAGAKLFGGRSVVAGVTSRLGSLGDVGKAVGSGLAEASAAGGLLEGTLAGVGAAAATAGGILVAAAAASWKFADGWAKSASSIGRTASIIGVSTRALQQFQGAAERVGVDNGTAGGAIGGLSETLNDARYGRNAQALSMLQRVGVGLKLNNDGTVNVDAMLPAIADAMARQNSSGRRTLAKGLGIGEGAIPVFAQGSKALSGDMRDVGKRGAVVTDTDISLAKKLQRRDAIAGQVVQRGVLDLQRANAEVVKGAGDVLSSGASKFKEVVADKFAPAAEKIDRAAGEIARAFSGWRGGGRMSAGNVVRHARHAMGEFRKYLALGMDPADAAGWAAVAEGESGSNPHAAQRGGPGRGLFQWGANTAKFDRRRDFQRLFGKPVEQASEAEQDQFRAWELAHTERNAARHIDAASGGGAKAAAITRYYERSANVSRDSADRANIAEQILKLEIDMRGALPGTRVKATAGRGPAPAISHALAH